MVIGVTAVAVALVRVSAVARLRRSAAVVPRLGGGVLLVTGAYVAYYGWYELRLAGNLRLSGTDPVVNAASEVQHTISGLVGRIGAGWLVTALVLLAAVGLAGTLRPVRSAGVQGSAVADGAGPVGRGRRGRDGSPGRQRSAGIERHDSGHRPYRLRESGHGGRRRQAVIHHHRVSVRRQPGRGSSQVVTEPDMVPVGWGPRRGPRGGTRGTGSR